MYTRTVVFFASVIIFAWWMFTFLGEPACEQPEIVMPGMIFTIIGIVSSLFLFGWIVGYICGRHDGINGLRGL